MGELFTGRIAAIAATAVVYALFALLRIVSQLIVDKDKLRRIETEVKAWEERRQRAIQSRDMKLFERVQREQNRIERLKKDADLERMKATAVTWLAWPILLTTLWRLTGDPFVALAPVPWGYERITLSAWFIVNTFWAGALLDRFASSVNFLIKAGKTATE